MTSEIKFVPDIFMKGREGVAVFDDKLGEKIASLRNACNISQKQLSKAIGKKNDYIYRIENGYFKPSTSSLLDICDYFGIAPIVLLNTNLERFEIVESFIKNSQRINDDERENVYEQFFAVIEEKLSEALQK